jgi:2-amino-4-hydroxy-6-hydroxymethyldihydropteridine diphosphokinase
MQIAYVGLGSNLAEPQRQLESALRAMRDIPLTHLLANSSFYATPPWGRANQPEFVNAVAKLETTLSARELLTELLAIERRAGRERNGERWGPRLLDLDLLLYGRAIIDEAALRVPHPYLHERAFVLVPLAELDADLDIPRVGRIGDLLRRMDVSGVVALESDAFATK